MKLFFISIILLSSHLYAFTLNNNFGGAFKKNRVKVYIADTSSCSQMTAAELESLIGPAIDNFWNEVPTSALRLSSGGFISSYTNIGTDRLCAPTDDACITAAAGAVIPPVKDIVISCNNNPDNFNNSNSVIAVTVPNNFSGRKITGAVILINDNSNAFFALSHSDQVSVIAHEIGHAIGLGHAESNHKEALMYYKTVNLRTSLGQDDVDGVSYLYPVKVDGCGLFSGSIDTDSNKGVPPFLQMGAMLITLIVLTEILKLLKRPKASPAL